MLIGLYFDTERVRISVHEYKNSIIPLFSVLLKIMTTHTVTAFASLIDPEAVTIKLETFGFFTIAKYFFIERIRLRNTVAFHDLFVMPWTFDWLLGLLYIWLQLLFLGLIFLGIFLRLGLLLRTCLFFWILLVNYFAVLLTLFFVLIWAVLAITFVRRSVPLYLTWNCSNIMVDVLYIRRIVDRILDMVRCLDNFHVMTEGVITLGNGCGMGVNFGR